MHTLHTEIEIAAAPDAVWAILTDSARLSEWNPFLHRLEGGLTPGNTLTIELGTPGRKRMTFRPRVLRAEPGRELRWRGKLLVRGLFDGEHCFELQPTPAGTRLRHYEHFTGLLVPLLRGMLERDTRPGFELMNRALKDRAEAPAFPGPAAGGHGPLSR